MRAHFVKGCTWFEVEHNEGLWGHESDNRRVQWRRQLLPLDLFSHSAVWDAAQGFHDLVISILNTEYLISQRVHEPSHSLIHT